MKIEKKKCKRCSQGFLLIIDNHDFCKPCRQPFPNVFECPGKCKVCEDINASPALTHRLRKHEIRRLKKSLPMPTSLIVREKSEQSFKNDNPLLGSTGTGNIVDEEGSCKLSRPLMKGEEIGSETANMQYTRNFSFRTNDAVSTDSLLRSFKEKSGGLGLTNYNNSSYSSSNFTALASFSGQSSLHINKPEAISTTDTSTPKFDKGNMDLYSKFCEFMRVQGIDKSSKDNLVSMHETHGYELTEKHSDAVNLDINRDVLFKVSSKASDILLSSTILSSPLQADVLRKKLKLDENSLTWSLDISLPDLLNTYTNYLPVMKLHPKVRHLQKFLFGKISPSLPQDILSSDFILPPLSLDLENKFYFARKQLQKSLFMFSVLDNYYTEDQVNASIKNKAMFEQLFGLLKDSIETQGNFIGLLLHDIRKELLREGICKDSEAITQLITGSVEETQFFGPYVKVLQSLVKKKGSSFCLRPVEKPKLEKPLPKPSLSLKKLPKPFKIGDNIHDFLSDLKSYFSANKISENDKVAMLETLLPCTIVNKLTMFLNPAKCTTRNFDEMTIYFERVASCDENYDYLSKRLAFKNSEQEADQSIAAFAKRLQEKVIDCNYGLYEKELLRDQFIFGLKDNDTRHELLDKYYFSFEQCCTFAASKEIKTKKKCNKATANNKIHKVQPKESMKKEMEFKAPPVIPCMKKKLETKEIMNLKESELNEQKVIPVTKRKLDTEEVVKLPIKKAQHSENSFYAQYAIFYDNPKLETIPIKSMQQWNNYYGSEAPFDYKVLCPWTGKILRTK